MHLTKRQQISFIVLFLVVLVSGGLIFRQIYKADELGTMTLTGTVFGQDTKAPLSDTQLLVASTQDNRQPLSTTTNASGQYTLALTDASYSNVSIVKDGYYDMEGVLVNAGGLANITANFSLKPGFGKEDVQITTIKKGGIGENTYFGLSLNPNDDSTSTLTEIVPVSNGSTTTYSEKKIAQNIKGYDFGTGTFLPASSTPYQTVAAGALPSGTIFTAAGYSPETDKYYLIGGPSAAAYTIYEYDRVKQTTSQVQTIPETLTQGKMAAMTYIAEIKAFLVILPTGHVYAYQAQSNKIISLGQILSNSGVQILRQNNLLYIFLEINNSSTRIITIPIANIKADFTNSCTETICSINPTDASIAIPRVGFVPYYAAAKTGGPSKDSIFLLGGIEAGAIKDTALQIDPANLKTDPIVVDNNHKLAIPIAYPAYQLGSDGRVYLFGGMTTINTSSSTGIQAATITNAPNKKTMTVRIDSSSSYLPRGSFESARPEFSETIFKTPFTNDNSNRTIIFSPNIQSVSGRLRLKAGQAYALESTARELTLITKGQSPKTAPTYNITKVGTNYISSWFATPNLNSGSLSDITLNYNNTNYTLADAAKQGIIDSTIWTSQPSSTAQRQIDLTKPITAETMSPGQYFVVRGLKDGVKIAIKQTEKDEATNSERILVDLPADISAYDIQKISQHDENISKEEKERLEAVYQRVQQKIQRKIAIEKILSSKQSTDYIVTLTKNGKEITPINNSQTNTSQNGTELKNTNKLFKLNSESFYLDSNYFELKTNGTLPVNSGITDNIGLSAAQEAVNRETDFVNIFGNYRGKSDRKVEVRKLNIESSKAQLLPTFLELYNEYLRADEERKNEISTRIKKKLGLTIQEYYDKFIVRQDFDKSDLKDLILDNLCNGEYIDSVEIVVVDTQCPFFNNQEIQYETFLHELSHAWRGYLNLDASIEEGLAEALPMIINNKDGNGKNSIHSIPIDWEYWTQQLPSELIGRTPLNELLDTNEGFPLDYNIWSRSISSQFWYKIYIENPAYFKELVSNISPSGIENLLQGKDPTDENIKIENTPLTDWIKQNSSFLSISSNLYRDIYPEEYERRTEKRDYYITSQFPGVKACFCQLIPRLPREIDPNRGITQEDYEKTIGQLALDCNNDFSQNSFLMMTKYEGSASSDEESIPSISSIVNNQIYLSTYKNDGSRVYVLPSVITTGEFGIKTNDLFSLSNSGNGRYQLVAIQKDLLINGQKSERAVNSRNLFIYNGQKEGAGIWGTIDSSSDTEIILEKIDSSGASSVIARTRSTNGIYQMPEATVSGKYILKIPSLNYTKYINKWSGGYELNIKLDNDKPNISNISTKKNIVKFKLNEAASTFIEYSDKKDEYYVTTFGKTINGVQEGDQAITGDRSIEIPELQPGETYHYRIWAIDKSGNVSHTEDQVLRNVGIDDVEVSDVTTTSAKISWKTDSKTKGWVEYGLSTNYGSKVEFSGEATKEHSVNLSNLTKNATYHFKIKAYIDDPANAFESDDYTFEITPFYIYNPSVSQTAGNVSISWQTIKSYGPPVESSKKYSYITLSGKKYEPSGPSSWHYLSIDSSELTLGQGYSGTIRAYANKDNDKINYKEQAVGFVYNPCNVQVESVSENAAYITYDKTWGEATSITINGKTYDTNLITGLTPLTKYTFDIPKCGKGGTFTTTLNTKNITTSTTSQTATVEWDTTVSAGSVVKAIRDCKETGDVNHCGEFIGIGAGGGTHHIATFSGLGPNRTYSLKFTQSSGDVSYDYGFGQIQTEPTVKILNGATGFAKISVANCSSNGTFGWCLSFKTSGDAKGTISANGLSYPFSSTSAGSAISQFVRVPTSWSITAGQHYCVSGALVKVYLESLNDRFDFTSASSCGNNYTSFNSQTTSIQSIPSIFGLKTVSQNDQAGTVTYTTNGDVQTQVEYGTQQDKDAYTDYVEPSGTTIAYHKAELALGNRTYFYRIVTLDEKGTKHYSKTYTLKHGHWFPRMINDFWAKIVAYFH